MAAHLEQAEGGRAFIDFSPILLEELSELAHAANALESQPATIEPLLDALRALPTTADARAALVVRCGVTKLDRLRERVVWPAVGDVASDSGLRDLVIAVHLSWWGEVDRRSNPVIARLLDKARDYDGADVVALRREVIRLLRELPERYRHLSQVGKVELAMTPYAHPIVPLLIDFQAARATVPDAPLPDGGYPGGRARARWHIEHGLEVFERVLGVRPLGCWPSEGAIDAESLALLDRAGLRWAASSEAVWKNSTLACAARPLRPVQLGTQHLRCFFRDDVLSNRIGFEYQHWHGDDAANNLVHELEDIARHEPGAVVTLILDGENAWEHYPDNAYHFLRALYEKLAASSLLNLTTPSAVLGHDCEQWAHAVPGSWVYGSLSTWIGDAEKNRAWQLLVAAKSTFDRCVPESSPRFARIAEQLARCEGSDWFWWLGAHNTSDNAQRFEELLRDHLRYLYELMEIAPPIELDDPIGIGSFGDDHGVMRGAGR